METKNNVLQNSRDLHSSSYTQRLISTSRCNCHRAESSFRYLKLKSILLRRESYAAAVKHGQLATHPRIWFVEVAHAQNFMLVESSDLTMQKCPLVQPSRNPSLTLDTLESSFAAMPRPTLQINAS